jgi:hypothetical protein
MFRDQGVRFQCYVMFLACWFVFRRKSRWELVRISSAVMGIEFSYAAETAFVSPTLLKIGKLSKSIQKFGQIFDTKVWQKLTKNW